MAPKVAARADFKSLIFLKRTISFDLKARALAPEN
jgi:hypothetical protein